MSGLRFFLITTVFIGLSNFVFAQRRDVEKVKRDIVLEKDLTKKYHHIAWLTGYYMQKGYADSMLTLTKQNLAIALKLKRDTMIAETYIDIGDAMGMKSDYEQCLMFTLKGLHMAERKHIKDTEVRALTNIGSTFEDMENNVEARKYIQRALDLLPESSAESQLYSAIFLNGHMTFLFLDSKQPLKAKPYLDKMTADYKKMVAKVGADSYTQIYNHWLQAFMAEQIETTSKADSVYNQTAIYGRKNNLPIVLCEVLIYYSRFKMKQMDLNQARLLAHEALHNAFKANLPLAAVRAADVISKAYDRLKLPDSANKYYRVKDSLQAKFFNRQRINKFQDIAFAEQIRQQEEAAKAQELKTQRAHNLQYAAIALGLVIFLLAYLIFIHTTIATQWLIKFLGVLSLLVFFEFVNLLLHPYVGEITHHSPFLMLLFMVGLAAVLIPLHHKIEHWLTHKMIERNNKVRLAALNKNRYLAQKDVEKLENND